MEAVRNGTQLLVLDDADSFRDENGWLDPILLVGVVDRTLRLNFAETSASDSAIPIPIGDNGKIDLSLMAYPPVKNLRRQAGLVLRRRRPSATCTT